jgi:hypothetical protein
VAAFDADQLDEVMPQEHAGVVTDEVERRAEALRDARGIVRLTCVLEQQAVAQRVHEQPPETVRHGVDDLTADRARPTRSQGMTADGSRPWIRIPSSCRPR